MSKSKKINKTRVIILESGFGGYVVFNPNTWEKESKAIIQSCASQLGLLYFLKDKINYNYDHVNDLCKSAFSELKKQYHLNKFPVDNMIYFSEVSEVHVNLVGFLSGIKTLLDFIVQLIGTEKIVNNKIHGFHKKGGIVGGELLSLLQSNVPAIQKNKAERIKTLVEKHKSDWIDDVVTTRDLYIHPIKGTGKMMFELKIKEKDGELSLEEIIKPNYKGKDFGHYSKKLLPLIEEFCIDLIKIIKS